VTQHLPQVRLIARKIHQQLPDCVSLDDLVSNGVLGLLAAIDNFDPSLDVQLATYAERRIRGAILDGLRDTDWAPREVRRRSRLIEAAMWRASRLHGRDATEEEISAELDVPLAEYQKWLTEAQGISLDRMESAAGEKAVAEEFSPSRLLERAELERILAAAIERIPKIERTVLDLYYFEEMNLREIGEVVGMGHSRVAQLRTQAILRLRSHLERVWSSPPAADFRRRIPKTLR
jgi:RNA polymerase sigma factor for flagellar operon FliA